MQIYVSSNYSEHSDWIDVDEDPDELRAEIERVLETKDWYIEESSPEIEGVGSMELDDLCEIASLVDSTTEDAFCAWLNYNGDLEYVKNSFEEAYIGEFNDEEDFAYEEMHGMYDIPDFIEMYIDWESVARDLTHDVDVVDAHGGGIYVFRCL